MKNVKNFGAVGDGKTLDTAVIQKAIDSGGAVYIPSGTYLTGTLYLKSNGGLFLAPGATLLASFNRADYNTVDFCPQNRAFTGEFMVGTHLIAAVNQENIFISGFGTIDGRSHHWVNERRKEPYGFMSHPPLEANRPGQMIFFAECRNIKVENVNLRHSPFWHLFFHGCEDVTVTGLNIKGERRQCVNDGIDIDCCSNVTVSNCIIDTGDDGITLRADGIPLTKKDAVCENVVVSNCIITSYLDYGIRVGVGNGIIKNCIFSDIIIKNSLLGIGMTCRFTPHDGCASAENIYFSNMIIDAKRAFELRISAMQSYPPLKNPGYITDITFNNIRAVTSRSCYILGFDNALCSDITFNNSNLRFIPESPDDERYPCEFSDIKNHDCVVYINKADNVTFNNFLIDKKDYLKYTVITENAENFHNTLKSRI